MITGMGDTKLPPFPRDSKAPLVDTPPAYSERLAPAPREVYTTASPAPHAHDAYPPPLASNPFSLPSTSRSQGPPPQTQFAHGSGRPVPAPPSLPSFPSPPSPPSPPPSHPARSADASSYQSSSTSTSTSKGKGKCKSTSASAPGKVARAMGQGMFALVAMPVVATAAAVYGSGKLIEGIGRGLSAGPEAVLKAYRKVDGKIKGAGAGQDAEAEKEKEKEKEAREREREREWHQYQYQQQQQQQQLQQQRKYEYEQQGEWGEAMPMKMEGSVGPGSRSGSLQTRMPMKASLMEDPSIGMARGVGSIEK